MAKDHRRLTEEVAQGVLLDDPAFLREIVQRVLQELLEAEMTEHVGAAPYERTTERKGHRNGHKPRSLTTRVGTLTLRVPQDRDGTFSTELFARYQRSEQALVTTLMEMYLQGVSTRNVKAAHGGTLRHRLFQVARLPLAAASTPNFRRGGSRPLTAPAYPYLVVDARYEHAGWTAGW